MNYRSILLIVFVVFLSCHAQDEQPQKITTVDIANHAQFWASKYVPELHQDEINLLVNILYFNGKLIDQQIKVGNAILFAYVHAGMINNLVLVSEEDAQKVALASAVALRKLKEEYLPARKNYEQILKHCIDELKKPEFAKLNALMEEFNHYGEAIASQFTKQDAQSISQILEECKTTFAQHLPIIEQSNETLQAILENRNPYLKDASNPDLANLHTAIYVSENAITTLSDMINKAIRIKRMMFDVMNITKIISYTFYQNTLHILEQAKRTPIFIMFNEKGVIAPDERWEDLPNILENN